MHQSSLDKMSAFRNEYLRDREEERLTVVDLGSCDVNGSYKPFFGMPAWKYIGVDMAPGNNVDVVLNDIYNWREFESSTVDVLISGQTFEHVEFIWLTMLEVARILKPGGLCCIIAPSNGIEHKYPVDCWRFYPDGFTALAHFAQLEVLKVSTQWENQGYKDGSDTWKDSMLVCRKPAYSESAIANITVERSLLTPEISLRRAQEKIQKLECDVNELKGVVKQADATIRKLKSELKWLTDKRFYKIYSRVTGFFSGYYAHS